MAEAVMLCCESFRFDAEKLLRGRGFSDIESEWVARKLSNDFKTSKERKSALHWVVTQGSYLYDADNIRKAVALASRYGIDPISVNSPEEIISKTEKNVEEDHVMALDEIAKSPLVSNREEVVSDSGTYVTFEIEDSREGMLFVRKVVDSQYGKSRNPWCLISRDRQTGSLDDAWRYWRKYCGCDKRIGFNPEGRIIAFSASNPFSDQNSDPQPYPSSAYYNAAKASYMTKYTDEYDASGSDKSFDNWLYDNYEDIWERLFNILDGDGWRPEYDALYIEGKNLWEDEREWWDMDDEPHYSVLECR